MRADEFDLIRQLDKVVVGAHGKCLGLDDRFLFRGQYDQRHVAGAGIRSQKLRQGQSVNFGHDQVLENHRGSDLVARRIASVGLLQKWKRMSFSELSMRCTASPTIA